MILILRFAEGMRCEGCGAVDKWCEVRMRLCLPCCSRRITYQTRKMRPALPAPWRAALHDLRKKYREFIKGVTAANAPILGAVVHHDREGKSNG